MKVNNLIVNGYDIDYPVKEYRDGRTWYRIWKSGFKECGDIVSFSGVDNKVITLPISFSNTDFVITWSEGHQYGEGSSSDTEGWDLGLMGSNKTNNTFRVSCVNEDRCCSYIARGF